MENNEIDKLLNDYKESLPPINHTKDEEDSIMNTILLKAKNRSTATQQKQSNYKFSGILEIIRNVLRNNSFRYSFGFAMLFVIVGIFFFYKYSAQNEDHLLTKKQIIQKQSPLFNKNQTIDTTLLASIDVDSDSRGSKISIDKKTVFEIIGKLLQKNHIPYVANTSLITQKIISDSGSIVLTFTYNQSSQRINIAAITQKPDIEKGVPVNVDALVKEIKTTLQHKVRMLHE